MSRSAVATYLRPCRNKVVWIWIPFEVALAIHEDQLAQYGGATGARDKGLLESALARPQNLASYGEPDAAAIATAYAYRIVRNQPFVDGNKRTAFALVEVLLVRNGWRLEVDDLGCIEAMLSLAEGTIDEQTFANWMRVHARKV